MQVVLSVHCHMEDPRSQPESKAALDSEIIRMRLEALDFLDMDSEPAVTFPDVAREEDRLQALAEPPFR